MYAFGAIGDGSSDKLLIIIFIENFKAIIFPHWLY